MLGRQCRLRQIDAIVGEDNVLAIGVAGVGCVRQCANWDESVGNIVRRGFIFSIEKGKCAFFFSFYSATVCDKQGGVRLSSVLEEVSMVIADAESISS